MTDTTIALSADGLKILKWMAGRTKGSFASRICVEALGMSLNTPFAIRRAKMSDLIGQKLAEEIGNGVFRITPAGRDFIEKNYGEPKP